MYALETFEGRVACIRVTSCDSVEEIKALTRDIFLASQKFPSTFVVAADFRQSKVFQPDVSDGFINILKMDNPRIERSAHVVGGRATFAMQLERLVREAANPARKVFRNTNEAVDFLSSVITPGQAAWLRLWFEKGAPKPAP